jgi:hypothetical protein
MMHEISREWRVCVWHWLALALALAKPLKSALALSHVRICDYRFAGGRCGGSTVHLELEVGLLQELRVHDVDATCYPISARPPSTVSMTV